MSRILNQLGQMVSKKASLAVLSAAAFAAPGLTSAAQAHGRPDIDVNIRLGSREPEYCERKTKVWVPAEYKTVCEKTWVEAIYEDRCNKVRIEPVYESRCEKVFVEPIYETRQVRRYDRHCGRYETVTERVCVQPGHFEERRHQVCVREGRYEEVKTRVCVREGRFETVDRQVLVCEGHYEYRTERVRVDKHRRSPIEVVNPRIRF